MSERGVFLGMPLDLLTMDQTVVRCLELVSEGRPYEHVVLNCSKVVLASDDERLRDVIMRADVVSADGQSVVWAGRLLGLPVPERVAGIDLMGELLVRAQDLGLPVYFLGAKPEVLARFVEVVTRRFPRLKVAGAADGYFEDDAATAEAIAAAGPRMLFVGMPSPRKEYFISEYLCRMGPVLAVGVGGSFDVWAGETARAPRWMRACGLEWFHRLCQEPRRMWRRYLIGNARFVGIVVVHIWSSIGQGRRGG